MQIVLKKKPRNPIIISGFPGFGLVSTISTQFLIEHLKTEKIGKIIIHSQQPIVAIHENKVIEPLGIYYNEEYNIVIIHAVNATTGEEWQIAESIGKIAHHLNAKEIISLEGVSTQGEQVSESKAFYYATRAENKEKFDKIQVEPLKEGIIMGVTGAILLKIEKIPVSCVFAEAHTELPDSKAAAKIIETLDKYLGLKVDYNPLLAQAQIFENKLKNILTKGKITEEMSEKKRMSYVG